jgi:hypothetical protein
MLPRVGGLPPHCRDRLQQVLEAEGRLHIDTS